MTWNHTIAAAATYYAAIAAFWCATWMSDHPVDNPIRDVIEDAPADDGERHSDHEQL